MKQKVQKNVWLRISMIVAVMLAFVGTTQAADELYKTALFGEGYNSGWYDYTTDWTATNDGFTVNVSYFMNYTKKTGHWSYILTHGDKKTLGIATITTPAIDKAVTKVQLTIDAIENSAPTIKLQSTADYATWTEEGTFTAAEGTQTVTVANPAENRYYRIYIETPAGESNTVSFSKVEFFVAAPDPDAPATPVISATNEPTFEASTVVTITVDDDATIMYSKTNGTHWEIYTGDITLTETTTIKAKAVKGTKESPIVSKSFILASDVSTATWNLRQTSTGVHTTNLLTWTNEAAAVLSFVKGAGQNLPTAPKQSAHSFQTNNMVTVAPAEGYAIVSVDFVVSSGASALQGTWSNATVSASGDRITVTAIDGTKPISTSFTDYCKIQEVDLNWSYSTSPYIAAADVTVPSAGEEGTITVDYNRISETPVLHVCDADGNDATYDWFTASLDADNNITYTIAANEGTERTAYVIVSAGNVESEIITVTQESAEGVEPITVTIGSAEYATFVAPANLSLPDGMIALIVTGASASSVAIEEITDIPANTAVVLNAAPGTYTFAEIASATSDVSGNLLKASDGTKQGAANIFCLANKEENGVGFYPVANTVTIPAGKAYLEVPVGEDNGNVKAFLGFEEDATAIAEVAAKAMNTTAIYNMAGQRLQKMQRGINIVKGKKVLF